MTTRNLNYLFKPRSIALIGAGERPSSVGAVLAHNLFNAGFEGPVSIGRARGASVFLTWYR